MLKPEINENMGVLHSALEKVGLWAHNCTDIEYVKSDYVEDNDESGVLMMHPSVITGLIDVLRIAEAAVPGLKQHVLAAHDIGGVREFIEKRQKEEL